MAKGDFTVLGAGPVGSLAGLFLAQRGYDVTLYEQRADIRQDRLAGGRSINLVLSSRGLTALAKVGLRDKVKPLLIPMSGRMLHDRDGVSLFQPYGSRGEEVIYSVSRNGLNRLVLEAAEEAGVTMLFSHQATAVDLDNQSLEFRCGSDHRKVAFRHILAADGAGSVARRAIVASGGRSSEEPLGHSYKELCIPAKDGQFQLEDNALHIWPRQNFMLIALPNTDRSFTVTLFMANEGTPSFATIDSQAKLDNFFEAEFRDAQRLIEPLADYFANPTGYLATVRCDRWHHSNKALLIGDAAHAIVPFQGQGMNCGFEDCTVLDQILDAEGDDVERAFARFANERKADCDAIADIALENYVEMRKTSSEKLFQMKKELGFELERRFPNRFVPRYSMIMFHDTPYSEAYRRGRMQDRILTELCRGLDDPRQADFQRAEQMINDELYPF